MATRMPEQTSGNVSGLTLGQRVARQQRDPCGYSLTDLEAMPLSQLGQLKVTFGKVNKGRTFEDATLSDPGWTKWCSEHLASSEKLEHRALVMYITRCTAQVEALEQRLLQGGEEGSEIVIPLTPAHGAGDGPNDYRVQELQEEVRILQQRVLPLEQRVLHLEAAMERMLQSLSPP